MSQIQLNYAFLLFWCILEEIHRELLFLVQRVTISEKNTEIIRIFFFKQVWKGANLEENLDLFNRLFFIKPVKWGKSLKKTWFSPQSEPHTILFCCYEAFWGKFTENFSFYSKKWLSKKGALKYSEICFS